jgi:hypothetical protein
VTGSRVFLENGFGKSRKWAARAYCPTDEIIDGRFCAKAEVTAGPAPKNVAEAGWRQIT